MERRTRIAKTIFQKKDNERNHFTNYWLSVYQLSRMCGMGKGIDPSKDQSRDPRNRHTEIWPNDF